MRKGRYIWLSLALGLSFSMLGQNLDYYSQLNQPATFGDARYNALAGNMVAMSGSFTALAINPAGAGLYRQEAFGMDMGIYTRRNTLNTGAVRGNTTNLNLNNFGYLGPDKASGWNFYFTYNSDHIYRERIRDNQSGTSSIQLQWLDGSAGTPPDFLPELGAYEDLLYQSYATDWDEDNMAYVSSANLNATDFTHTYFRKGMRNRWTLGGGSHYGNTLFYGAAVNVVHSFETVEIEHKETYSSTTDLTSFEVIDFWNNSAIGLSANAGVLYRPVQFFRVAASLETPQFYSFSQDWEVQMKAIRPSITASGSTAEGYGLEYQWSMMTAPKLHSGATVVLGRSALLTVNHTLVAHSWSQSLSRNENYLNPIIDTALSMQHMVGGASEVRLGPVTLRGGVSYSPEFRENFGDMVRYGLGIGLRADDINLHIGWTKTVQNMQYYPFSSNYIDALKYESVESMLSVGAVWKF